MLMFSRFQHRENILQIILLEVHNPWIKWPLIEIVIDANMGLAVAPQVVIDATKSIMQCTGMDDPNTLTFSVLEPIQRWVVP